MTITRNTSAGSILEIKGQQRSKIDVTSSLMSNKEASLAEGFDDLPLSIRFAGQMDC
jgi:hypothetical protein